MFSKLRNTVKHSIIYSLGNLSTKIVGLILLPLYTSYLSTAEYGKLALLETTAMFLVAVFGLRLYVAMMRWWADSKTETEKQSTVFTTYLSLIIIAILINVGFQLFNDSWSNLFFNTTRFSIYFKILFFSVGFEIVNAVTFSLLRLLERSKLFIILNISKLIIILSFNVYFITKLNYGVKGIILSQLIGQTFIFIASIPIIFKQINFQFNKIVFIEMFKYSYPLIFTAISSLTLTLGDRYFLKVFLGYSELGIYSLAIKIAGLLNVFIIQSFQMGFLPIAFKTYKEPNAPRFFAKIFTYFTGVLLVVSLVLAFYGKEVIQLFSPGNNEYWQASTYIPFLCTVYILKGMEYVFIVGLHISKKTKINFFIVLFAAVLNIGLNILLIPKLRINGAILSSFISGVFTFFLFHFYSNKYYKIKYEVRRILKLIVTSILLFTLSRIVAISDLILFIIYKTILFIIFPVILYYWNFFEEVEILRLKQAWVKWRNPTNWKDNLRKEQ